MIDKDKALGCGLMCLSAAIVLLGCGACAYIIYICKLIGGG